MPGIPLNRIPSAQVPGVAVARSMASAKPGSRVLPGEPTSKIHFVADGRCQPLAVVITPGQAGDAPAFEQVMARLRVPRLISRPRVTPDEAWLTGPTRPGRSDIICGGAESGR